MENLDEYLCSQTTAGEEEFLEWLEEKYADADSMSRYIDHLIDEKLGK